MQPTIGRIVHYYTDLVENQNKPGPYAATIVAVHSDTCVTLAVLMPWRHDVFVASSAQRKDVVGEQGSYWVWPPHEPAPRIPELIG